MKTCVFIALFGCYALAGLAQIPKANGPATGASYKLLQTIKVGGEGGWDYLAVDEAAQRLYLSHATQVDVLDLRTRQKVGVIPNTPGVHGIAPVAKLGRGYITNGRNNTLTVFDLKTLKELASVPTGNRPDAVLYDEFSNRVFVFNNGATTATVVDAASNKAVGTVELGGAPEAGASDGKGLIFVNLEDKSEIVGFDAKTLAVKHRWSVAPGEEPSGLAIDRANHLLFSVCGNQKAIVVDTQTGKIVGEVAIGKGVDGAVFDLATHAAVSSNGEGSLTVIHEEGPMRFRAETIPSVRGARTIALDPITHHLFLSTAEYGPTPAPTTAVPRPRPSIVPGTFEVLEFGK